VITLQTYQLLSCNVRFQSHDFGSRFFSRDEEQRRYAHRCVGPGRKHRRWSWDENAKDNQITETEKMILLISYYIRDFIFIFSLLRTSARSGSRKILIVLGSF
jgi:hypothetical protein